MFLKIKTMFNLFKEGAARKVTSKNWTWCLETNRDDSISVYRLLEKLGVLAGYENEKTIEGHHANGCPQCCKSLSKSHCNSKPIIIRHMTQTAHGHIEESSKGNLIYKRVCWIHKEP
jgi:hypothetical protein